MRIRGSATVAAVIMSLSTSAVVAPAAAAVPVKAYASCKALNKVYKHGVGVPGARDKVRSAHPRVTNYTRNVKVYQKNARLLDRDKDGIACEKR